MYTGIAENDPSKEIYERISLNVPWESNNKEDIFTEAVFVDGKKKVQVLEEKIQKVKDKLEEEITKQDNSIKERRGKSAGGKKPLELFDPKLFWKDNVFKELEDELIKIFGFRNVEIHPYIEKYNSNTKKFQTKMMNCFVWSNDRFPIEGLVTDNGFYDKSRSTNMQIQITLGLIKSLEADEILGVLLHEFGHGIDPALVDIKYSQVNVLSKYMTDRKNAINKSEEKAVNGKGLTDGGITFIILLFDLLIILLPFIPYLLRKLSDTIVSLFVGKEKATERRLDKIRKMVDKDKDKFNRREFAEAYADNFARMYGYASSLMRGLKKISLDNDKTVNSRCKKEIFRQQNIVEITYMLIKDEHKTDIHRIRNLIKEYKDDIDDPNTPSAVKKQLKDDLAELEKVLDEYLNNFSEFQNRVNHVINEELQKIEVDDTSSDKTEKKAIKEGVEFFDESHKAYEKLMKAKESLSSSEREEVNKIFGHSNKCSFAKDKDGYYCFTHRARSDSYPTIAEIPKKSVEFVRSTC